MRKREFISLIAGATAWPLTARAQQSAMPVIGYLSEVPGVAHLNPAFQRGMAELGYACFERTWFPSIVLARQKNPTHHEDERGQFARYLKGENPEGADQVYDGTDGQSPMMRHILEGDNTPSPTKSTSIPTPTYG